MHDTSKESLVGVVAGLKTKCLLIDPGTSELPTHVSILYLCLYHCSSIINIHTIVPW